MYNKFIKRILDIIFSLLLLVPILIVLIPVSLLIFIEDRGPIFYLGKRLGKNEKIFKMYKLRSMKVNAPDIRNEDGSTFNASDDPRLTKMGKFIRKTSIDELPQIFNVLLGDMSFVGPRPDLPEHINHYEGNEIDKLNVLPGITGYNQAYFRNSAQWKDRLKHDVFYVNNMSFVMDVKILVQTVFSVLLRKGVFVSEEEKSNE